MIDEEGKILGVMKRGAALERARDKGLDLIELSPLARPPVARIMSFDKFRYQLEKRLKKQHTGKKQHILKQVQISGRIARNDLQVKARKTNEFLQAGNPVTIVLVLRGRQKGNREWAHEKLREFLSFINPHRIITQPKIMGRGIHVQITTQK